MDNEYQVYDEEDGFYDDPRLSGGRRCTAFVIDVGEHMLAQDQHGDVYLRKALVQARDYINSLALAADMAERVTILFINAPPTAEGFANGFLQYYPERNLDGKLMDNITAELVQSLNELIDEEDIVEEFQKKFGKGPSLADIPSVIRECDRYFFEEKALQKVVNIYSRNYALESSTDLLDSIKRRLASFDKSIHLFVNLVDLHPGQEPVEFWDIIDPEFKYRLESPDPSTTFVESSLRSTAKIPFLMGHGVEIPVSVYALVRERPAPRYIKLDSKSNEVVEQTAFFARINPETTDENQPAALSNLINEQEAVKTEGVLAEHRLQLNQATLYRKTTIGDRDIVLNQSEFESLRRVEPKGIRLIGFKKMSTLKDSHRMGPSYYLYPIEDIVTHSAKLYTCLYKSCLKKDVYALASITFRSNMQPKLCALIPQARITGESDSHPIYANYTYEGFHAVQLPFMQNKRNLQELYQQRERHLAPKDGPILEPVKRLVERLTSDYVPDKFVSTNVQAHYRMVECLALKYDTDKCADQMKKFVATRQPFYKNPGLHDELKDELDEINKIISGADPNNETLAKKRKAGAPSTRGRGSKRGRT